MRSTTLPVVRLTLLAALLALAAPQTRAGDQPDKKVDKMLRAVFHINFADAERQGHGLKNMENILKAVGKADIEVVCHGEGISLVTKKQSKHADKIGALQKQGVRFVGCENTLKQKSLSRDDLLPEVSTVPSGAVEILQKQQQGYGYFRP